MLADLPPVLEIVDTTADQDVTAKVTVDTDNDCHPILDLKLEV